jgi:hypothetical protein
VSRYPKLGSRISNLVAPAANRRILSDGSVRVASVFMTIEFAVKHKVLVPTTRKARTGSQSTIHPKLTGRGGPAQLVAHMALAGRLVTPMLCSFYHKLHDVSAPFVLNRETKTIS